MAFAYICSIGQVTLRGGAQLEWVELLDFKKEMYQQGIGVNSPHEDDDDLEDFEEENSFEEGNEIFELRSQVNSLKIEKQKLIIEHQSAMASIEVKNQQLTHTNAQLRRDNSTLNAKLTNFQEEYEELKKNYDVLKDQFDAIARKTADFRRSSDGHQASIGDASDLINEMLQKDKTIGLLSKQLEEYKKMEGSSGAHGGVEEGCSEEERVKLEGEIRSLKQSVDELKKKEIAYKREYEGMLQSKEEIIKKMASQNEDFSRKIIDSKDKIIHEMRKELEEALARNDTIKGEIKTLNDQLVASEGEVNRMRMEFRKKEEKLLQSYEVEKQDMSKGMNEKLKKYVKEKEEKLSKAEDKIYELENQILVFRQEVGKQKAELNSHEQLTTYLETSNKEYEESKKKLQALLYEREKELGELRQTYFSETSELKKTIIHERAAMEQKASVLEEEIVFLKMQIDKIMDEKRLIEENEDEEKRRHMSLNTREIEKLRREKEELYEEYLALQERYKEKSDKMLKLDKSIRQEFEERVSSLENELIKERQRGREQKQSLIQGNVEKKSHIEAEYEKLKDILELAEIGKTELEADLRKERQDKLKVEKEKGEVNSKLREVERKLKDKQDDYRYLEISYEELKEKYKSGVKDLEDQISLMTSEIKEERRKAEKRRKQMQESDSAVAAQIKGYKDRIAQLEEECDSYRTNKVEDAQYTDLKLQKLATEIGVVMKDKEAAIKNHERQSKEKEQVHEEEKQKLMEYIEQLEENNEILNRKLSMMENKERKNVGGLEKEMRNLKVEYSQSLKETNMLLQKQKKLEEIHQEVLGDMECLKNDNEALNKKYLEIYREKNKLFDELNCAYDQINKLNMVLMSKEEQISRSKTIHCPHFEQKPTNMSNYSNREALHSLHSAKSRSPIMKNEGGYVFRDRKSNYN